MGSFFTKPFQPHHLLQQIGDLQYENTQSRIALQAANSKIEALKAKLSPKNPEEARVLQTISETKATGAYENLVLEGGGTKGLAYCGALRVLDRRGILGRLKRYAGSSAGAITATLLAVGYTPGEMETIIGATDFGAFVDDKPGFLRDAYKVLNEWGMASGDYFHGFMGDLIKAKTGNPDTTFAELEALNGKTLVITGTDVSSMQCRYYCAQLTPDMSVRQAVRISMSIPFMFTPVQDEDGCLHVDGGIVDNYPIHAFDGSYPGDEAALLNLCPSCPKTLGLKILTPEEDVGFRITTRPPPIKSLKDFAMAIMSTLMVANERKHLRPSYWKRTVVIKVADLPLTKFDLSDKEKHDLVKAGEDGAIRFFAKLGEE